jgi:hypothetical protein
MQYVSGHPADAYNITLVLRFLKTPGATCSNLTRKDKGKAVPLQAWSGTEGSRNLRYPDFMKTAQYGGKVVSLTHRPILPPGNTPGTHFLLEVESTPGP